MLVLIKDLGKRYNGVRNYRWGLYKCPKCGETLERMRHQGDKQEQCPKCFREYHKQTQTKHGGRYKKLYRTWVNMRQRCNNKNSLKYKTYGAKGITICKEWDDYSSFEKWAHTNGFEETLTIDRINPSSGYSPDNCQWITNSENAGKDKHLTIGRKLKLSISKEKYIEIEKRRESETLSSILDDIKSSDTAYRNAKKRYSV